MTMPSVEVMPTLRPMPLKMWAIMREVVVFPFVPVTATIGTREGEPGREQQVDDGLGDVLRLADGRVGVHAETRGGVDLADGPTGLAHRGGDVGADEVDARHIEADHAGRLLGDLDVVGVRVEGAVDRDAAGRHVAGQRQLDHLALVGARPPCAKPCCADQRHRRGVDLDAGQHLLVPDASAGVGVGELDELGDGVVAVADRRGPGPARRWPASCRPR